MFELFDEYVCTCPVGCLYQDELVDGLPPCVDCVYIMRYEDLPDV